MRPFLLIRLAVLIACLNLFSSVALAGTAEQNTYVRLVTKGMEQMKAGDYRSARDSFGEALRYNDADSAAHLGLGLAAFHLRDDLDAERELSKALVLDPNSVPALQWLGELYYRRDDMESAIASWERALVLDPAAEAVRVRIERVKKEHLAEKDFNRDLTSHFQIKYEGREKIEAGRIVRGILEDAYSELGRALSYYPDADIQVILYSAKQFQEVTDAPGWSAGLYDGKIRIPVGGIERETPALRRLLYHEYTHAVVRAITPRCPTWLNEGLAQYFEGKRPDESQIAMLRKLAQAGKIPALSGLEGSFAGLNSGQAGLAYLVSLSAVTYMADNFGMYRVREVLDQLASGAAAAAALNNGILVSSEEFERGWKKMLE